MNCELKIKWYGTNALEIKHNHGSFMIDPYVSRNRKQLTIPSEIDKYLISKPDFVLMTHAHWDHLPDMPYLIQKTDTILYASRTACNIMRTLGVPEKNLHQLTYGEVIEMPGGVFVTALESRHKGSDDILPGYDTPPAAELLAKSDNWRCGEVFSFLIELEGKTLMNMGSANLHVPSMSGADCDWLLGGISRFTPDFPERLMRNIHFKCLIPTHHDEFTLPLDQTYLRNDLDRLKEAIPNLPVRQLPLLQWEEL
ncbi:MAG: MBL fold metallo-hydrolase [Victivallales bacterium]|nr:MBL fold metallo-hydrolase [Victivallales bacterium]